MQQCLLRSAVPLLVLDGSANVMLENTALTTAGKPVLVSNKRITAAEGSGEIETTSAVPENQGAPSVTLSHCTWWLDNGSVFVLTPAAALTVRLDRSVFAKLRGEQPTVMVAVQEEPSSTSSELRLELDNCVFYRVQEFIIREIERQESEVLLAEPRNWRLNNLDVKEKACVRLRVHPWASKDPLKALEEGRKAEAFRLRVEGSELRSQHQQQTVLGVQKLLGESLYDTGLPAPLISLNSEPEVRELTVDGIGGKPDTFDSLSSALTSEVAEGAKQLVINLRISGPVPIRSLLDISGQRQVTIRAVQGFSPELTFREGRVPESNTITSLFRVHDGHLIIERVRFRLTPLASANVRWQAVVNITGSGSCTLRQCYASLEGEEVEPHLALIAITDPTGTMIPQPGKPNSFGETKPGSLGEPTKVVMEDCFLRGEGVGVYVAESRPLQWNMKNCLAVLDAPLLRVETSRTEMNAWRSGEIACTLEQVTVCNTEPIVTLAATKENAQPIPVRWHTLDCLFVVQANMEQPLLRVEGPQNELELRRSWLIWSGQADRPSVCSVNGPALVWRPLGQEAMMTTLAADRAEWSNFWGTNSEEIRFVRQWRWAGYQSEGEKPSFKAEPQQFQILPGLLPVPLQHVGADLARLPGYQANPPSPQP
ncbi:hypothetical protein HRbin36_00163 [bacterium HR36]|nr:hypothetical protein HRbin36_00163 [bacterium HR36]